MTELEALAIVKTEVDKTINGYKTVVIKRVYEGMSIYEATIAVILRDDAITPKTLVDLYNKIKTDSLDMDVVGTSKDIQDLDFEVLTIKAKITL